MSVREWQGPRRWTTNHAGIASSADGGQSWSRPPESVWTNRLRHDHPFQVCAFALNRDALHLLGTPNGRFGDAHLARVEPEHVADPAAYRYLAGSEWVADPFAARPVFGGPVGELAVVYHRYLGRWLAMYLYERRAAVVLRSAERWTVRGPSPSCSPPAGSTRRSTAPTRTRGRWTARSCTGACPSGTRTTCS